MPAGNAVVKAFNDGKKEGQRETRHEVLSYIEKEFMNPDIERGSEMYHELLRIAAELSKLMGGRT